MALTGPGKTIIVEPAERPVRREVDPEPEREKIVAPVEPEKVPA